MLQRLTALLVQHAPTVPTASEVRTDAESLRRISMTLRKWFELECGNSNDTQSWAIVRGNWVNNVGACKILHRHKTRDSVFEHDDDGTPFIESHVNHWRRDGTTGQQVNTCTTHYHGLDDREAGARRRLAKILANYPGLTAYVQGDPRGCALYIIKSDDIPAGASIDSCYSRGLAVYQ